MPSADNEKNENLTLQLLVSAVNRDLDELIEIMQIDSEAIIINQCDRYSAEVKQRNDHTILCFNMAEKGVGLSRNNALFKSTADIVLFADEDIIYNPGYEQAVLKEFKENPDVDMIMFNVQAMPGRETYHIEEKGKVTRLNCGRYPTYSVAVRREKVIEKNITFSLLFGGGAKYSNGEDSLFINECLKRGMKAICVPVELGYEQTRESSWFRGFNEKFFYDRGVLFAHLYGNAAYAMGLRFVYTKKKEMCQDMEPKRALAILNRGISDGFKELK